MPSGCAVVARQVASHAFTAAIAPNRTTTLNDVGPLTNDLLDKAHVQNTSVILVESDLMVVDCGFPTLPSNQTFDEAELDSLSHSALTATHSGFSWKYLRINSRVQKQPRASASLNGSLRHRTRAFLIVVPRRKTLLSEWL